MIEYVKGDATAPIGPKREIKIIAHIVNNAGAWGAGFVIALSNRWDKPEAAYRRWSKGEWAGALELGKTQFVPVPGDLVVANMCAQDNRSSINPPVRYDALTHCMRVVGERARAMNASIHMPRIGCGIGGGRWEEIEPIIEETCKGVRVVVYDLP
jgi:O-acetyl-ADP-ribose deacetylase (regulator of RNase III)